MASSACLVSHCRYQHATKRRSSLPGRIYSISTKQHRASTRSSLTESFSSEYGYVCVVAASSYALVQWQAIQVALARKKFDVPYPSMYEEAVDSTFNCYQRAHANTLETYPAFLLLGGIGHPTSSAGIGALWIFSRILYSFGYYTGDPGKRIWGLWGNLLPWFLAFLTAETGITLIQRAAQ